MYGLLSTISDRISQPLTALIDSNADNPLLFTLLLGLAGAVAPCQLTGNMSAITFYGNRTVQLKDDWKEVFFFIAGKIVVFSSLGFLAWLLGQSFEESIVEFFPVFRKGIGPLIIVTGLVLMGVLKIEGLHRITTRIPMRFKEGKIGSFLLGVSFSLAFCPTMFIIFFVWLMPVVVTTSYGFALPAIFGLATSLPLLILFFFIWFFDAKRLIMKRSRKVGRTIQYVAGCLLVVIGIFDTMTYWGF